MIQRETRLVTVFGGGGFIGRYVCEELMTAGVRVRVACREPRSAHYIQPLGQIGQYGLVRAEIARPETVRRAIEGATAVINLAGSFDHMQAVHATGARNVAQAARDAGVRALVHISAIGADPDSPGHYGRTKAEGEAEVRKAFPNATVIRPSIVFGPEDDLTNRLAALAKLPALPVVAPECRFQPVFVEDLAKAIARAVLDADAHAGKTYEIGGPNVMSMKQLTQAILAASGQETELVEMPAFVSALISWLGFLPFAPLTRDQWLMLQRDTVPAKGARGLEAFGVRPTPFAAVAPAWLGRFRRGGRFAMYSSDSAA